MGGDRLAYAVALFRIVLMVCAFHALPLRVGIFTIWSFAATFRSNSSTARSVLIFSTLP